MSEGERKLKRAETNKAIKDLGNNFKKQQLQNIVTAIDAQLAGEKDLNEKGLFHL
ncbi:MAG: hypothetical protein LBB53_05250 [Prevotellaceae bacterium]|nr:hypothetical protein [Prevotellaceae bacterium]